MSWVTVEWWTILLSFSAVLWRIHCYFIKKEKLDQKVSRACEEAEDNIYKFHNDFHSGLKNNLNYKISSSLEEIDSVNPCETVTYKKLLREKHKAWIAYLERHRLCVHKEELIVLLKEIEDDEALVRRALNLIWFT